MNYPNEMYYLIGIMALVAFVGLTVLGKKVSQVPPFEARPLMNKTEAKVFKVLVEVLPDDWILMCQVSYGSFLKNKDFGAYRKVNSKRADFVAVGKDLTVKAVIEYQGSGHFGRTQKSREKAIESDRIKRLSTSQAGIVFIEIPAKFSHETIEGQIANHGLSSEQQAADHSTGNTALAEVDLESGKGQTNHLKFSRKEPPLR